MQRSIWVSTEDWALIKEAAKLAHRTLSQYLIHLHKMNITSRGIIPPAVCVDSEELDHNPEKYPEGTACLIPEDHPSIVKKIDQVNKTFNPRPKGQDGISKGKKK